MRIEKKLLGDWKGQEVIQICMENDRNMKVSLLSYGAAVQSIHIPDRERTLSNVVLSFADWRDYIDNPLYAGASLGPCSGRISHGRLPMDGKEYRLTLNDGMHHIHGGSHNISHHNWITEQAQNCGTFLSARFKIQLEHGLDGYPGRRTIQAHYTLDNDNTFSMRYTASSDRDTYFNLSNHSYFDLSGRFDGSALNQKLTIPGTAYVQNDSQHIPFAVAGCCHSPFDFTAPGATLSGQMQKYPDDGQILNARGYNHAFLLNGPIIKLADHPSGRTLQITTDAPCVVVYSGGFIGDEHKLLNGCSCDSCAIALEAQDIPDIMHLDPEQYRITQKGQVYERNISYRF